MASLPPQNTLSNSHPVRPQKSHIFPDCPEIEPTTSLMVSLLVRIQFKLLHTPGSKMIQSDTLSHCSDHTVDNNDNDDIILLPDSLFVRIIDINLHYSIFEATVKDTLFASALEALKTNGPFPITSKLEDWCLEDGLLFFKDRCFMPADEDLR